MNHFNRADDAIRELLAFAPTDPVERLAFFIDAVREDFIESFFEAEKHADELSEKAAEVTAAEEAESDEIVELQSALTEAAEKVETALQAKAALEKRCQELLEENAALRIQLRGEPVDLDTIIQSSTNVIKPTFGDNAKRAYSLYCQASQVDEQDPFEAEQLYRRAIALDPKLAIAWTNLGNCLCRLNRTERAIECWQKALTIEPRQPEAHFNLGHIARERGNDTEAEKHLKNAIDSDNHFPMRTTRSARSTSNNRSRRKRERALSGSSHWIRTASSRMTYGRC